MYEFILFLFFFKQKLMGRKGGGKGNNSLISTFHVSTKWNLNESSFSKQCCRTNTSFRSYYKLLTRNLRKFINKPIQRGEFFAAAWERNFSQMKIYRLFFPIDDFFSTPTKVSIRRKSGYWSAIFQRIFTLSLFARISTSSVVFYIWMRRLVSLIYPLVNS